jgi:hypothetical protein
MDGGTENWTDPLLELLVAAKNTLNRVNIEQILVLLDQENLAFSLSKHSFGLRKVYS